ncbi:MAG: DUF4339 domain-containing protein [Bacteroidales bacterium]|nr:DUF4339 domain-containing protein [Bacteroidales bacterium]
MNQYYYIQNGERKGPVTLEGLNDMQFSPGTKFWCIGLERWTPISEIDELKHLCWAVPPPLPQEENPQPIEEQSLTSLLPSAKEKKHFIAKVWLSVCIGLAAIILLVVCIIPRKSEADLLYKEIVASAYDDPDVDFQFYLDKYYRDLEFFDIIPTHPHKTIIKFANLDKITDVRHAHAMSYGYDRDDIIEIYINPSSWAKFGKAMRYWLMYHELTHDILNIDDLADIPSNFGKLMYPVLISYEGKTMDEFIESFHEFIEEYGN